MNLVNKNFWYLSGGNDLGWNAVSPLDTTVKSKLSSLNLSSNGTSIKNNVLNLNATGGDLTQYVFGYLCILDLKNEFYTITGDTCNVYRNNPVNLQSFIDSTRYQLISIIYSNLDSNEDLIYQYLDEHNLIDEYIGSTSKIEKLGYVLCAYIKEIDNLMDNNGN